MAKTRVGYEANPNGNLWLKDDSGFGQKMLAKMGWKAGQGLGRQEQGIKQAIRIARKQDNRGVGCTRQWAEAGNQQMDAFAAVLANLNEQHGAAEESAQHEGLEESSRRSRHRLHYAKFTRGKDVTRCSDQALLSIFGSRSAGKKQEEEEEEKEESKDSGVRHIQSSLSTAEYFKQKMEAMRARLKTSASAPDLSEAKQEGEEEEEEEEACGRPTFRLGADLSDDLEEGEISTGSRAPADMDLQPDPKQQVQRAESEEKEQRRRRKEARRRRRREGQEAEEQEEASSADNEEKEERRRMKEERRRRRAAKRSHEAINGDKTGSGQEESAPHSDEEASKRRKKRKKRKGSDESEEETALKQRKVRPSTAAMTEEQANAFATGNKEIMQHLEWSSFSTSNLGLVVGYKYAGV